MANEQNLIPIRTESQARELGQRGGIASGIARRERKRLRELAVAMVNTPVQMDSGPYSMNKWFEKFNIPEPTMIDIILARLIDNAYSGDIQATKLLFAVIGNTPSQIPFPTGPMTKQKFKVSYEAQRQNFG